MASSEALLLLQAMAASKMCFFARLLIACLVSLSRILLSSLVCGTTLRSEGLYSQYGA